MALTVENCERRSDPQADTDQLSVAALSCLSTHKRERLPRRERRRRRIQPVLAGAPGDGRTVEPVYVLTHVPHLDPLGLQ